MTASDAAGSALTGYGLPDSRGRNPAFWITAAVTAGFLIWLWWPAKTGDPEYVPRVTRPAFASDPPRVVIDEAHWNLHRAGGRYQPFADLLRADGYRVEGEDQRFTAAMLAQVDVLVVANALGARGMLQHLATVLGFERTAHFGGSAFNGYECAAVREWVEGGGALLLITDHAPAGEAAAALAREFGVELRNGFAEEPHTHDPASDNWGTLVFSRANGQLGEHPITAGRDASERIEQVITYTGGAMSVPPGATPFLSLSAEARLYPWRNSPDNFFSPAAGLAQGVALLLGRGRVVVMGEAAGLSSETVHRPGITYRFGLSREDYDNQQLALNILHWLSGVLG